MDMNKQFGVREIANVVLKAKTDMEFGKSKFKANEPVLYFDTLKTSTVEGAATTVYATGGRGNARLISWDGERTITFTMEDALISPMSLAILSGAGLVESTTEVLHFTERVKCDTEGKLLLSHNVATTQPLYAGKVAEDGTTADKLEIELLTPEAGTEKKDGNKILGYEVAVTDAVVDETYFVDYYAVQAGSLLIDIEPGKFSGNFYLEAATLFRDIDGKDHAAEFIIPNCRVQSNFTFSMASSGDPSTFTFTMDAFPGYTTYDKTKKVLCAIQVLGE